ncbi:aminotransferase [Vibrio sp. UCD-FRSSP16_10]|uniref:aminotransferase class V-fold PLP-dependent enzyme n=1 Tax=unclassified Vibrio TaxID=2614977 RepID=UPI0007FFE514|nr:MULTISPECIES: aminotransferase class V-fold PLP-dependent enzyme [unclassified Vibrio]OBT14760.1 aminotransferase [Vibrio sp. UCD-FRSSP16_30]OBT20049.1 aminotransferase [Vibrio sp. UCD-FRSSP16_10]
MSKTTSKFNRRDFLKGSAGVAVAGLGTSMFSTGAAAKHPGFHPGNSNSSDKNFWKQVKKQFSLAKDSVYMNIGTTGSIPTSVLQTLTENNELVAQYPWDMQNKFGSWPYVSNMVADIAPGFGADENEIVINRNTTDGMVSVISGLDLKKGDIILTTHHEHMGGTSPLFTATERVGAHVVKVEIPVYTGKGHLTKKDYVKVFADAINEHNTEGKVRLVMFSHITYRTGTLLPAKEICALARNNRIPTLVDAAHTIGMMNLDLHDLDCDFYAGSGHKWQCGPGATGILYIRQEAERLTEFWPADRRPFYLVNSSMGEDSYQTMSVATRMQYVGNDNYPAKQAFTDSCKLWDEIGRDKIEERILDLSALCKEELGQRLPKGVLFCSPNRELSSGLTSFNPFADDLLNGTRLTEFRDRLREEYGYIIRTTNFPVKLTDTSDTYALRISTHLFHDEDEVTGLVEAMAHLYKQMA